MTCALPGEQAETEQLSELDERRRGRRACVGTASTWPTPDDATFVPLESQGIKPGSAGRMASDAYKVIDFLVSVFIDRDGVVGAVYIGQMNAQLMGAYTRAAIDAGPAPEAPFKLRLIANPGHENLHLVEKSAPTGQLPFASRSFRCDPVCYLDNIPPDLRSLAPIRDVTFDRLSEPPTLNVLFSPTAANDEAGIAAASDALAADPAPPYEGALRIRREGQ